ncbi:glycosyltransferase family 2 protein, partial [Bacillus sp. 5001]|uniref:glycosyltransferase family 2 protein n=1 Tax=Bacillus sp. 5001 TaxID=3118199 RepID=UPI003FA59F9F
MSKLISIVVPVYNKEPFIERCVQSLVDLEMDHSLIEAIFVDDVSSDRSYEILQYYDDKYDFIKCIQLEQNSGSPAEPRNVGIEVANGEYIALLDADDWLDKK